MEAKQLMERLAQERADGRHFSNETQQQTVTFAEQRHAEGASWKAIGAELGISWHTLMYSSNRYRASAPRA